MRINLPASLERSLLDEVRSGHFVTVDDAIAEAVRLLLRSKSSDPEPEPVVASQPATPGSKPIWEVFEEIASSVPEEEWAKLPIDGAEQHDHYIHGTPKRPSS